jgi:hypothetical protein
MSCSPFVKVCGWCCQEKAIAEFHKRNASSDGVQSQCKLCLRDGINALRAHRRFKERMDRELRLSNPRHFEKRPA